MVRVGAGRKIGFGVDLDLRSLGLFRIALGLLAALDFALRWADLQVFYTDAGLLPRELARQLFSESRFSLLSYFDGLVFAQILVVLGFVSGLMLALGWRHQVFLWLTLLLCYSFNLRNPLIDYGGDTVLRVLLLWSLFLPLGERFAWGQKSSSWRPNRYAEIPAWGLFLQVVFIYLFAGLSKRNDQWFPEGTAGYYALSLDMVTSSFGRQLLEYPALVRFGTKLTWVLEIFGPLLLFIRGTWLRSATLLAFMAFQIGLALVFDLYLFPYLNLIALLALLPSSFWGGNEELAPKTFRPLRDLLVVLLLLLVHAMNLPSVFAPRTTAPEGWLQALKHSPLHQDWRLFAPRPHNLEHWYVWEGEAADGRRVDPVMGSREAPSHAKPAQFFPDHRWLKFYESTRHEPEARARSYLAGQLCARWRAQHPGEAPLRSVTLLAYPDPTPDPSYEGVVSPRAPTTQIYACGT